MAVKLTKRHQGTRAFRLKEAFW